jgi:serine/threonine protein kinase
MSDSSMPPTDDEQVLAQLMSDLDDIGPWAVDDYIHRYPRLAGRIRDIVRMQDQLADSKRLVGSTVPEQLGEFRLVRPIATGGMGEIYEAIQERLNRRVALKVIRRGRITPDMRARFLREQAILAKLHQTHIVPIHTAGEEGPLQYFAMPYIDGAGLNHVIQTATLLKNECPRGHTPTLAARIHNHELKCRDFSESAIG